MANLMRTPTKAEALPFVSVKLNVWLDLASRYAWMVCSIPDHDPSVGTHRSDHIRVLRLISSFVDLARMVDLLDNGKCDVDWRLFRRATSISTNFSRVCIIVVDIGLIVRVW